MYFIRIFSNDFILLGSKNRRQLCNPQSTIYLETLYYELDCKAYEDKKIYLKTFFNLYYLSVIVSKSGNLEIDQCEADDIYTCPCYVVVSIAGREI